ncbi:hypothetical protein [Nocardia farcinica]|uniref:hypothetical protein n=1 Tax=Nocardia farcinica TaxID=37329 RepID=UPI002455BF03|nr:hypothetical protein [Nocardia farcinica]
MAAENTARRWWGSIGAGVLLCVGCCLAPLLIAAGVLGGGTLLVGLSWLEPVGFALIGVGVAGLIWSQRRVRRRKCGSGSSSGSCGGSGCGCTAVSTVT